MQNVTAAQTASTSTIRRVLPNTYWALAAVLMALVSVTNESWAGTAAVVLFCVVPLAVRFVHDMVTAPSVRPQDAQAR